MGFRDIALPYVCTSLRPSNSRPQTNSTAIEPTAKHYQESRNDNHPVSTIQGVIPQSPVDSAQAPRTSASMRLSCFLLFVLCLVVSLAPSNGALTTSKHSRDVSRKNDRIQDSRKRLLRADSNAAKPIATNSIDDEERVSMASVKESVKKWMTTVKSVNVKETLKSWMATAKRVKEGLKWFWNIIKMKLKLKFWLSRETTPEKVFENLNIKTKTDKNYGYYSRYFYNYYVTYPAKQPKNLPAKTAHSIMTARIYNWLKSNKSPPQVFAEMGFKGPFASAAGHPDYVYFDLYRQMWGALQARVSQANL